MTEMASIYRKEYRSVNSSNLPVNPSSYRKILTVGISSGNEPISLYNKNLSSSSLQLNYQVFKLDMSLPDGIYNIRLVPRDPPLPGFVLATSQGLGAQIVAKLAGPAPSDQDWKVVALDSGGHKEYIITLAVSPKEGWTLKEEIPDHVPVPVILTNRFTRWILTPVDPEKHIYRIIEPGIVVGVIKAVGVENNRLFVKSYPITPELQVPEWQFTPPHN